ncbi:Smr/MutS family protein [Uruburuella testudinis]|uniref:Smr/MutS family protein n=1 Tax=Uruburuella testudinis TaxID=1282863 RepID=A0ABY4DW39_9NEIS|nr:Smr/MutS family protein [Uruburuella testudinis]UOO83230.1 Smr/MutS family protein [Uruburuella testudinis]
MSNDFQSTLKNLGKQAKAAAQARAEAEDAKRKQNAGQVDFAKEMADVIPLKNTNRYTPPRDSSPIKPRAKEAAASDADDYFYVGDGGWGEPPATFSKNGQGQNDIRRLQSGHWPVVADVDLHGYTQEQAQQVLNEFILFVARRGVCGEIVHGSGLGSAGYKPVLKNTVRRWLMAHPDVLAYAELHQGNDGAVRILIKRNNR